MNNPRNLINGRVPEFGNPEHIKFFKEEAERIKYDPTTDKGLKNFVKDFTEGILGGMNSYGMCLLVCDPLSGYMEFCGIKNKIVECSINVGHTYTQHFFIELEDGRIIDPTANQFENPATGKPMPHYYLGKRPKWYLPSKVVKLS